MRPVILALAVAAASPALADFNDRPPNATGQQPAFPGQTRAPVMPDEIALQRQVVAEGLRQPWGLAELPDGSWLVTEKPGRLRLIAPDGRVSAPIAGVPQVDTRGQGGLLDVIVAPDFAQTRRLWLSYAEPRAGGLTATAVAGFTLAPDGGALADGQVLFRQEPPWDSDKHYGSRLVLDRDGGLFITTGERANADSRVLAQDVTTDLGKVVRIDPLTGAPRGAGIKGGRPEIWSYGHRNLQAAALGPDGALWTVEHGPKGGDELNRPEPGRNYGWPVVTYGEEYSGQPVGEGVTAAPGVEQPVYYWDPVIAPSGMAFYEGAMFPEWRGDALIGGLQARALVRLHLENGRVTGEARHLEGIGRVRDVAVARDGAVMILTDAENGALIRISRGD